MKTTPEQTTYPPVLDACCGSRMFWFDKEDSRALFVDIRKETWIIDKGTPGTKGRKPIVVSPDIIADFTALPSLIRKKQPFLEWTRIPRPRRSSVHQQVWTQP